MSLATAVSSIAPLKPTRWQLLSVMYKRYTFLKSQGFNVKHKMDYSMPLRVVALGVYSTIALR
ncbi:hypothetical protein C0989_003126 [Termitomyces sp. Mn162]|nr:hypothetical protein C0989_003126 [Termitomyces sp. Mn162]